MKIKLYQIDAFTDKVFHGNPAAVCILDNRLEDDIMQNIAGENNLAETAFVLKKDNSFEIRWFTPKIEVDLCGHATLASAYVLFNYYKYKEDRITFYSPRSGNLYVEKSGDSLILDFPADKLETYRLSETLENAFAFLPTESLCGNSDFLLIFSNQKEIENIKPDLNKIASSGKRGVIVSAPGNDVDFVSRFFAPQSGINEDPVTGSAHTSLTPYWSKRLSKTKLTAKQLSERGGYLECELHGNRVKISGKAVLYLIGEVYI